MRKVRDVCAHRATSGAAMRAEVDHVRAETCGTLEPACRAGSSARDGQDFTDAASGGWPVHT